jgi:hypothetical protein
MRFRACCLCGLVGLGLLAGCAAKRAEPPTTAAVIVEFQRAVEAGRHFYQSQALVQYGMTAADVHARLGAPLAVETSPEGVVWAYATNRHEVLLLWFEQGVYVETVLTTRDTLRRVGQWGRRPQTQ